MKGVTIFGLLCKLDRRIREKYATDGDPSLRNEMTWDIISALRGPDQYEIIVDDNEIYPADELKHLTTARVRAIVGFTRSMDTGLNIRETPLNNDEIVFRNKLLHHAEPHFTSHFRVAMRTLHMLGYPVPVKELNFHAREPEELEEVDE